MSSGARDTRSPALFQTEPPDTRQLEREELKIDPHDQPEKVQFYSVLQRGLATTETDIL